MKNISWPLVLVFLIIGAYILRSVFFGEKISNVVVPPNNQTASTTETVSPFLYSFNVDGIVKEASYMKDTTSPYWWVNSGAYLYIKDGVGETIQGMLATSDERRLRYSRNNPEETDNGYHPQNIFRLVTRLKWQNFQQQVYFNISKINLSESKNRNDSNGFFLFNRYQDGDNLYYTGIRVDGTAMIKKKINGVYYTMSQKSFYAEGKPYDHDTNPNLIPIEKWIGIRSEVKTNPDGTVSIKVFIDKDKTGDWVLAVETTDDGKSFGGKSITNEGYGGIRTDFMDVKFDDYEVTSI